MFTHKNQKQFYSDYAIKNGQVLDETTLNLYGRRLKKELDNTYNLIASFAALEPVEYNKNTSYEIGEIVGYNKNSYIALKTTRGNEPTNTDYWKPFTEFAHANNLTTLEDFLSKDNQNPYNPAELKDGEETIAYHPATVKYVEDSITDMLSNGVITNADRLDGYHADDFVTKQQFLDLNDSLKDLDISAFVPVTIEMPIDMNELTKTQVGDLIKVLPYEGFQNFFKIVNLKDHYNYKFNTNTIVYASIEDTDLQQTLVVCIAGPFEGFGCVEGDYTNGQIVLTLIMNKETKDYDEFRIESNCTKILTQAEYDEIENKSEYIQYVITDGSGGSGSGGSGSGPTGTYTVQADLEVAKTSPTTALTLADDAVGKSQAEIMEFLGITPVVFANGEEVAELDPNDYSKLKDGSPLQIADGYDIMMRFPKRGVKFVEDGNILRVSITTVDNAAGFDYGAFKRGDTIQDNFYYGAYEGNVSGNKLYSRPNLEVSTSISQTNFRNYARARGERYQLCSGQMIKYIQACYMLVHQSLDSQTTVGKGVTSASAKVRTGLADTYGMNMELAPASAKTSGINAVKCLGIENLWGNVYKWHDGIRTDSSYNLIMSDDPDNYNNAGVGYYIAAKNFEINGATSSYGYTSSVVCSNAAGFYPAKKNGSGSTYFCDYGGHYASCAGFFGGSWSSGDYAGLFCWNLYFSSSDASSSVGGRLAWL